MKLKNPQVFTFSFLGILSLILIAQQGRKTISVVQGWNAWGSITQTVVTGKWISSSSQWIANQYPGTGIFFPLELKEADKVFSFLYFFLHFVAGCGDFSLRREDCTDERQNSATNRRVESPAQGAVSQFVSRSIMSTIAYCFLASPTCRVKYQA